MRRFSFRLEKLLRLRERQEEMQRVATAVQQGKVSRITDYQSGLMEQERGLRGELAGKRGRRWSGKEQQENYRYLRRLVGDVARAGQALAKEEAQLRKERETLVERSRRRKIVERLRERRVEEWRSAAEAEERVVLDEVAQVAEIRKRERGSIAVSAVLLLVAIAAGAFGFMVWRSWLKTGETGYPFIRAPFEKVAERRVVREIEAFEFEQRVRRKKRDDLIREARAEGPIVMVEEGGDRIGRTLRLIEQKEEALRRKEEDLKQKEKMAEGALREVQDEQTVREAIERRIDEKLAELKVLEDRRKKEMSEEKRQKLESLIKTVSKQKPKSAAELLLAVAFPDPLDVNAPPFPLGEGYEGSELVVKVLEGMNEKDRAEVFDGMMRISPAQTGVLFDMLDNVKTGQEPES
jgi:flagellar FliJ protein